MDRGYLKDSLKALLPITLVFCYFYVSGHLSSDYYFHVGYSGNGNYPPFLSWIMPETERGEFLFFLNLSLTTIFPFMLIHKITKKMEAGWAYLYSGIPLVLFVVWLIPQSMIHNLMLLSIAFPEMILVFLMFGWAIHQYWWAAFMLTLAFMLYQRQKGLRVVLDEF